MNLFNLIRNWFVAMGVLIVLSIAVFFLLPPDNSPLTKSTFFYLMCLALLVDVLCLLRWVGIKRKFLKEKNHV